RKLSKASSEKEIDDWKDEIKDRFGNPPKEAEFLILASKIKLFASKNYFTKVTIRAERMWLLCPKQDSDMGKEFYDSGKFQEVMEKIESIKKDNFQLVQKNETVRFVIQDIPDIKAALDFVRELAGAEVHA